MVRQALLQTLSSTFFKSSKYPAINKILNFFLINPIPLNPNNHNTTNHHHYAPIHTSIPPKPPNPNPNYNPNTLHQLLQQKNNLGFNNISEARQLFDDMLQMKPLPSVIHFGLLLSAIGRMKHDSVVLSMFNEMCALSSDVVLVDLVTINTVINCCCRCNRVGYGFALFGVVFKRGFVPDVFTFNILIKGLLVENKVVEAEDLFRRLVKGGEIVADEVTYGTLINGLCKTRNSKMAIRLLREMENGSCGPNTVVYSSIVDGLCKEKLVDDALSLFSEMKEKGISADVIIYNSLIQGLCSIGRWTESEEMLREMIDLNLSPDMHTFTILVDALCKEGRAKEAEGVVKLMRQKGVHPDVITYTALIHGYCLLRKMDRALAVFSIMINEGIVPNYRSYDILMCGYRHKLGVDGVDVDDWLPNDVTYTIILGLLQNKKYNEVVSLIDTMTTGKGLSADASSTSLRICQMN